MRYLMVVAVLVSIVVAVFFTRANESLKSLEKAPDIEFYLLNGQPKSLSGFAGRPIVLHFWATWCAPCIEEFPRLLGIVKAHPEWQFILLSADEKEEALVPFLQKMEASSGIAMGTLPNLVLAWDPGKHLSQEVFQTVSYPETLVLGPDLTMHDKIVGAVSLEKLEDAIRQRPDPRS